MRKQVTVLVEHVVAYIGNPSSGPAWSVPALCSALAANQAQVRLHILEPRPDREFDFQVRHYPRRRFPHGKLWRSPELRRGLRQAAASAEIMHSHSLWTLPCIYPGPAVRNTRCRLVVSPRGTLSAWSLARSRWLKRLVMAMGQRRVLEEAACLHATAVSEYEDIRRAGLRAPVAVIPNGVDVPVHDSSSRAANGARRRLLFLGRIHPEKSVDHLLRAWRAVQDAFPEWELRVVGPMSGEYPAEIQSLSRQLGCEQVTYPGAAYREAKSREFLDANLFVLPSPSENFGMAVAEALAHGLPAIVTKGAPWAGLEQEHCGWWIDIGEASLAECLHDAMSRSPVELQAMGHRAREWMIRDFSWKEIGRKMLATYRWLLDGGAPPEWVRTD